MTVAPQGPTLPSALKRVLVTGGGGFIGSNLVDGLLAAGADVVVYDDFRTGHRTFLSDALATGRATVVEGDVLDQATLTEAMQGCDLVVHLAANADVRYGLEHPVKDLEQNTIATSRVLEAMRAADVRRIAFSSTGSVYGEPEVFPTPEDAPFPLQTSLYGASKLAGEGLLAAYATGYGMSAIIFRFVSILGERYTHGHVHDFWHSLRRDPTRLQVLGDGRQQKSYLYVGDCVAGILRAVTEHVDDAGAFVYNLGHPDTLVVDESVGYICDQLGVDPVVEHTGGTRGWIGDSPLIHLDCARMHALGWAPATAIPDAVAATVRWLDANAEVLEGNRRMSLYATQAPLRISLGGGGTDLPSYYRDHEGFLVAGAIDKYVYMMVHTVFQKTYRMKYSAFEEVGDPSEIKHPLLREAILRHWGGAPLEIASVADVPSGTGMGSSGSFTVAVLKALALAKKTSITPGGLAERACEIEIDILGEPVGKQDQYVAAHGGICTYTFHTDGTVTVEPLALGDETLTDLHHKMLLFYTGASRSASAILADQVERTRHGDEAMLENLHRVKSMGYQSADLLRSGDLGGYAELMHEHWQLKRERSPGMSDPHIDDLYTLARRSGVVGGKLVGAGGGGFLLVYAQRPDDTRQAMAAAGAQELAFDFDFQGARGRDLG